MADNYLEKKYEQLQERKAKEARKRQIAWKKRMDAYRKSLEKSSVTCEVGVEDSSSAKVQGDNV